jgi:hypothetical protein
MKVAATIIIAIIGLQFLGAQRVSHKILSLIITIWSIHEIWNNPRLKRKYADMDPNFFKQQVLPDLVQFIESRLMFSQSTPNITSEIRLSQLFSNKIDFTNTQDCVFGILQNRETAMLEISVGHYEKKKIKHQNKTKTITTSVVDFKGLIFLIDYPTLSQGQTVITPDGLEGMMGWLINEARGLISNKHIQMPNPLFEKEFKVNTTDPVHAHEILNSVMMENILQLKEKFQKKIALSFFDSTMVLIFEKEDDFLEFSSENSERWEYIALKMVQEISYILDLIEGMDIDENNQRQHKVAA